MQTETERLVKQQLQEEIRGRSPKELFEKAFRWYGLPEKQCREILIAKGYEKFNRTLWFNYLNVLREHWPHLIQIREEQRQRERQKEQRLELERSLVRVVVDGVWHWEGSEEALKAHWQLEDERRAERVKQFMRRSYLWMTTIS